MRRNSMRLYLAGAENNHYYEVAKKDNRASFLTSYYYIYKRKPICMNEPNDLFLDSGAFSAMHSGAQINIDAYIEFIKEHGTKFEKVAALDCIGDWRGTEKNLQYMRGKGVNPIPVFHTNEPFDYLDNLLKENDYLCLGVTGSKLRQPQIIAWLVEVFKRRERINPDCKMHGFALTSAKIMKYFDWDSCDSTTWLVAYKFMNAMADDCTRQYKKAQLHKIFQNMPTQDELAFHNVKTIYNYIDKINTLKGKAVVSPRPTV